jgi:manganese oxidase
MGSAGMGEMASMEMPLPENTLPMMRGHAQFGPVEMGGMFSVVKVRPGLARNDYRDPGWYPHPSGTVAYEWKGDPLPEPSRSSNTSEGGRVPLRAADPRRNRTNPKAPPRSNQ